YLQSHRPDKFRNRNIYIYDKNSKKLDLFYRTEKNWWTVFTRPLDTAPVLSGEMFFLQRKRKERSYRITSLLGKKMKRYPLNTDEIGQKGIYIFHVSGSPLRFLLRSNKSVVIYKPDGSIEKRIKADAVSAWGNKLLIFNKGNMTLYELNDEIAKIFERSGKYRKVLRRFGSEVQKKVVFKNGRDSFIYNFKDGSTIKRKVNRNLIYYKVINNKFHLVYLTAEGVAADIYEGEKLIGHESWETGMTGYRRVLVFEKGIVVSNGKEYEKYLFKNIN
ncbi:MAG: hypothetical protein KAR14_09560, partial [Candidatus Aminicenantes bacterium]|nr:hypothetical protein [Candidatus Aminicenantes bacterium]